MHLDVRLVVLAVLVLAATMVLRIPADALHQRWEFWPGGWQYMPEWWTALPGWFTAALSHEPAVTTWLPRISLALLLAAIIARVVALRRARNRSEA